MYLYSVPAYTGMQLTPETAADLANHSNIVGMKDSQAAIAEFVRTQRRTEDADFNLMIGSASVLAQALNAGATGGIVALANLAPESTVEVYAAHHENSERARALNAELIDLNKAITATYGVPGLKWAMRERGAPAGHPRAPHQAPDDAACERIRALLEALETVRA